MFLREGTIVKTVDTVEETDRVIISKKPFGSTEMAYATVGQLVQTANGVTAEELDDALAAKQDVSATLTALSSATAAGLALMDDANAAAQRTTLGLGTAATLNTTDSATSDSSSAVATTAMVHNATYTLVDKYGAVGDGVYVGTVTTVSGDNTVTATGVNWTAADVGKAIVIAGAAAAGATLSTTISAVNSPTSIEVTVAPSTSIAGTGKCYYGTDDTAFIQAAIDATPNGGGVLFRPGGIYMASNLRLKTSNTSNHGFVKKGLGSVVGMATIVAIGTGDDDYLLASDRWVTGAANGTFADTPWHLVNLKVDSFGLKDICFVNKTYDSAASHCEFTNARVACYRLTRQNQDGSLGTTAYLSGTSLYRCQFTVSLAGLAPLYGFQTQGTAADDTDSPTDGCMLDCQAFGYTGTAIFGVAMRWGNTGGWTVIGNRTWDSTEGLGIGALGKNMAFRGNNWDANSGVAARIGKIGTYVDFGAMQGETFYSDLVVDFSDDATTEVFSVEGCHFWFDPVQTTSGVGGDGQARIVHNNNRASKTIRSRGNFFQAENGHQRGAGNTLGVFDVYGYGSIEDTTTYQRQFHDSGATGVVDRTLHDSASPAASDVVFRYEHAGRNSAAATKAYAATEAYIQDATSASEDGAWRVKVMVAGTEVTGLQVSPFLFQQIAGGATVGGYHVGESVVTKSLTRYSADATCPAWVTYKGRGTIASPAGINQFDELFRFTAGGYSSSALRDSVRLNAFCMAASPSSSDMQSEFRMAACPAGSATISDFATFGHNGIGYRTGAGGTVTQATSKSTGVTLNKPSGQITMHNASLASATAVGFTLTNSCIAAADVVHVSIKSGATADCYAVTVDAVAAGSCRISLHNVSGGSLGEAVVLNFAIIKAATS